MTMAMLMTDVFLLRFARSVDVGDDVDICIDDDDVDISNLDVSCCWRCRLLMLWDVSGDVWLGIFFYRCYRLMGVLAGHECFAIVEAVYLTKLSMLCDCRFLWSVLYQLAIFKLPMSILVVSALV